jgi:L,D-peptidoglycan transpeptidase YkuD (ErfK/YbiS/YcfS/YnhG family)
MRAEVFPDGRFLLGRHVFPCVLGKGGVRADKQEGDGATPVGLLPLRRVLYRADRLPAPECAVPVEPIAPDDAWCEDPASPHYNRPIRLTGDATGDRLWRADHVYDVIGVLGWNDAPVQRGRGSAIFLHLARPNRTPTDGCVALDLPDLLRVLALGLTEIQVHAA